MTGLLVSVRNVAEAMAALSGGADVIDVKEPDQGALGAATPEVISEIFAAVDGRAPVSAALGELLPSVSLPLHSLPNLRFAKLGLAGCRENTQWPSLYAAAWQELPTSIGRVAVAYGDWQSCKAPAPETVVRIGHENDCRHLLLDTVDKSKRLTDHTTLDQIDKWTALAKTHGMELVFAGSVAIAQLEPICRRWAPKWVAVRGAACIAGRSTQISEERVHALRKSLDTIAIQT